MPSDLWYVRLKIYSICPVHDQEHKHHGRFFLESLTIYFCGKFTDLNHDAAPSMLLVILPAQTLYILKPTAPWLAPSSRCRPFLKAY